MEVDLYFEPIFWLLCGMPQKTQKPAAKNCIYCRGKSWALVVNPLLSAKLSVTFPGTERYCCLANIKLYYYYYY